ncbi:MAG TPA: methyltransferase domain-containing protein [Candidatus Cybelea sp.]|nr:methyltransferase domain-containing protein [Candidatus Cybelea sp.]
MSTSANSAERPGTAANPDLIATLRCPRCGGSISADGAALKCRGCAQSYPVSDGIPQLFVPNEWHGRLDVTDMVKDFYEETPFPNYDDMDSRESLVDKAGRGLFAALLDRQIPPGALVLEAGCGTGQLSNFLGMNWQRRVIGADLCLNSLKLANGFRNRFSIVNAAFVQMNLFRPPFADESFDLVVSNGVLHHTADPEGGFRALSAKIKPGGTIVVGLYNWLGRLPTLWRRRLIEMFGDRMAGLDSRLRGGALNSGRWSAWFRDQYKHPHESKHSMDEVLRWFDAAGFEFLASIPAIGDAEFAEDEHLFAPHPKGNRLDRLSSELDLLLSGGSDGGLYIMIGRKRAPASG